MKKISIKAVLIGGVVDVFSTMVLALPLTFYVTPPRENRACRGPRSGLLILNPTHSHLSRGGLQHTVATATTVWATPFGNPATDGTFSHVRRLHRLNYPSRDVAGADQQLAISH